MNSQLSLSPNGLELRIQQAILSSPYPPLRKLHFVAHEGHVSLKGRVNSFHHKQVAQELLKEVEGIQQIDNELEVVWA
jgi:osmotically-inducible protein OsmY